MTELASVKAMIRSFLISSNRPEGLPMQSLWKDYKEMEGRELPYFKFGFRSLEDFLRSIPDICYFTPMKTLKPVLVEENSHISKLVSSSRKNNNRRPNKARYTGNYYTRNNSYTSNQNNYGKTQSVFVGKLNINRPSFHHNYSQSFHNYYGSPNQYFGPPIPTPPPSASRSNGQFFFVQSKQNQTSANQKLPAPPSIAASSVPPKPTIQLVQKPVEKPKEQPFYKLVQKPLEAVKQCDPEPKALCAINSFEPQFDENEPQDLIDFDSANLSVESVKVPSIGEKSAAESLIDSPLPEDAIELDLNDRFGSINLGKSNGIVTKSCALSEANDDLISFADENQEYTKDIDSHEILKEEELRKRDVFDLPDDFEEIGKSFSMSSKNPFKDTISSDPFENLADDDLIFALDHPPFAGESCKIPEYKTAFEVGSQFRIFLSEIHSPSRFWFQEAEKCFVLDNLMGDIENYYGKLRPHELKFHESRMKIGHVCAAKIFDVWHRGEIIDAPKDGQVRIFFLDYGTNYCIDVNDVKYLLTEFVKTPRQIFRGCLTGIQPSDKSLFWELEATREMLNIVTNKMCWAYCAKIDEENGLVHHLAVVWLSKTQEVNVSRQLLLKGFAATANESMCVNGKVVRGIGPACYRYPKFKTLETTSYASYSDRIHFKKKHGVDYSLLEYTFLLMESNAAVLDNPDLIKALKINDVPIIAKIKKYYAYKKQSP